MDVLRIGKISSINHAKGTARVTYPDRGGDTTPEIPFPSWFYWMPKIGDQVLVAHLPNGPASAVILCPFWHDGNRPTEGFPGLYKQEYAREPGLAGERYDAETKDYNQSVTGNALVSATESWTAQAGEESAAIQLHSDGTITITAKKLVIQAPDLEFIDGISVTSEKPMTVNAPQSLTVTSALSTFNSSVKVQGDANIAGISFYGHTHTGTHGETSGPH
jgi:phage baseplate assembly protein V